MLLLGVLGLLDLVTPLPPKLKAGPPVLLVTLQSADATDATVPGATLSSPETGMGVDWWYPVLMWVRDPKSP